MNRKEFIKGTLLTGLGLTLPDNKSLTRKPSISVQSNDCVLIPRETAGPFPLDLAENNAFFRQDVRESEDGVPLNLKMRIIGADNCEPMQNLRVNIWHCNKDGLYSGYSGNNNPGQTGLTYLRGYQFTDANGEVEFITILPGWYTGRICHIHFQVYVSSAYSAISQLTFDIETKNAVYSANPTLYTKGQDPLNFSNDNIFSDGHEFQLATLKESIEHDGFDSFMEVIVQGSGTTGIGHIERETAKYFELGQNYPNPYLEKTTIPITVKRPSKMKLDLWDLSGKKVATIIDNELNSGNYDIEINVPSLNLPFENYVYQLEARNENGIFRLPKMMTRI